MFAPEGSPVHVCFHDVDAGIDPLMAQLICNRVNAVVQAKAV